jgi:cytochrome c oxidase subunit 2
LTPTNEELAKERAQAVRSALVAAGVPEARTTLAPPTSVTGGADDAEARRVEIRPKL